LRLDDRYLELVADALAHEVVAAHLRDAGIGYEPVLGLRIAGARRMLSDLPADRAADAGRPDR
jgi:hypothetical protein